MRLCSFSKDGENRYGAYAPDGIVDLTSRIGDKYPTLVKLLELQGIDDARKASMGCASDFALGDIEFLPLTEEPVLVICNGMNYRDHVAETGNGTDAFPRGFIKLRDSLVGHGQELRRPPESDEFDFEIELMVVIGKTAWRVSTDEAMDYVAGYTILNDGSVRDYQKRSIFQGKNFYRSSSLGPCMLTADAAPPWSDTTVETRLNGQTMQKATLDLLIFDIPFLISYFSQVTPLHPGDMISTGTPAGVGSRRKPPVYLKPGDEIEFEVTDIGTLANTVVNGT